MTPTKLADWVTPETSVDRTIAAAKKFVDAARGKDDSDWTELRKERHGAALTIVILAAELEATKEKVAVYADMDRQMCASFNALAEERDGLRSQNARLVALLEDDNMPASWPGSFCSYPLLERCCWTTHRERPCYQHGKRALLAEIKGGG